MKVALIKGDGIGAEIVNEGVKVLESVGKKYNIDFEFSEAQVGGIAIDNYGDPLPKESLEICKNSDSILLGAVGGEKWDNLPVEKRPEKGLLRLRKELNLYANLRPAIIYGQLKDACPLKDEIIGDKLDILVLRELTGGIYFGKHTYTDTKASDLLEYSKEEIERIARVAFESARKRNNKVTSVDKANVLASSKLWRNVVTELSKEYSDVTLEHMYVDNAAMQLVRNPKQFDVLLTENMFGDILSDEASMITGSIGMLPSASLGSGTLGVYEPIHGSAPDIAGKNIANPIATILSCAMMLRYSFNKTKEAQAIEDAVSKALSQGYRTADIANGKPSISTSEMGDIIAENII